MKRFFVYCLLLLPGMARAGDGYEYEWLSLGPTADLSTSMAVTWRTAASQTEACAQIAIAGPSAEIRQGASTWTAETEIHDDYGSVMAYHKVVFKDLVPGLSYLYRVGDGHRQWSEWFPFRTASGPRGTFKFIYMGDVQSGIMDQYPRVVRRAFAEAPDAALIVFTGDLTERALESQYGEFFRANHPFLAQVPVVAVPDNHEYPRDSLGVRSRLGTWWGHLFARPSTGHSRLDRDGFFSFDYQGCRFICLNTRQFEDYDPVETEEVYGWLESLLRDNPCRWTVVVQHKPVWCSADGRQEDASALRQRALYEEYGVDLVLSGHDHVYSRTTTRIKGRKTVPVCITSMAGSGMYVPAYRDVHDRIGSDMQLFQVVEVKDGALLFQSYDAQGRLYDGFRIDARRCGRRVVDLAPDTPMRTILPSRRREKYSEERWHQLDSIRQAFESCHLQN